MTPIEFVIATAKRAGDEVLMANYGRIQTLEWLTRTNFRTEVDKESDTFICEEIGRVFPDDGIYS